MPYPVLVVPFLKVNGIAIFPFILLKNSADKYNEKLIRHETIHLRQELEMLILPFYLCYLANYFFNRLKYNPYDAYMQIAFEREAYAEEGNSGYLQKRKFWGWVKY